MDLEPSVDFFCCESMYLKSHWIMVVMGPTPAVSLAFQSRSKWLIPLSVATTKRE
jgi:hypothetical protein